MGIVAARVAREGQCDPADAGSAWLDGARAFGRVPRRRVLAA